MYCAYCFASFLKYFHNGIYIYTCITYKRFHCAYVRLYDNTHIITLFHYSVAPKYYLTSINFPLKIIKICGIYKSYAIYLSTWISSNGPNKTEISSKIAKAKMSFQRIKSINTSPSTLEDVPWNAILNHHGVWMRGLDNFKKAAKETRGNRNMIPTGSSRNLMDRKEIKRSSVTRS